MFSRVCTKSECKVQKSAHVFYQHLEFVPRVNAKCKRAHMFSRVCTKSECKVQKSTHVFYQHLEFVPRVNARCKRAHMFSSSS